MSIGINMNTIIFSVVLYSTSVPATPGQNSNSSFTTILKNNISFFDSAYNTWSENRFLAVLEKFNAMEAQYPENYLLPYWQGVVQFHLISYSLFGFPEHRNKSAAKKYVAEALTSLNSALKIKPDDCESLALLGTITGMKISLKPLQAPVLGPRVLSAIKKAMAIDSTNPRVYYLVGVSYHNTPAFLGGGVDKGLEYLLKAEKFYIEEAARSVDPAAPRWGRSTCLGFIAQSYVEKKEYKKARIYYNKALAVNPSDQMAKTGLEKLENQKK